MTKRYDEEVAVTLDQGLPTAVKWRSRDYKVSDVVGRWRIEGRWWEDGKDREFWRVEMRGGAAFDLYQDRNRKTWHIERIWD